MMFHMVVRSPSISSIGLQWKEALELDIADRDALFERLQNLREDEAKAWGGPHKGL